MTDSRTSNLVSIVIQKPGQVPDRKGPYPYDQVEPTLRELYKIYPGIVCIVMPGLPADCYPQHGHEYLDMLDAERCKCKLDKPRNPKCPVDHSRRAFETTCTHPPEDRDEGERKYFGPYCIKCGVDLPEEPTPPHPGPSIAKAFANSPRRVSQKASELHAYGPQAAAMVSDVTMLAHART